MHKRFYEYQKMVILQSAKIGELTPLMEAVINPTVQLTDDLIATYAGMAMDGIHRYGRWNIFSPTALMLAAAYNNVDGVRKLIDTTEVRMQNAHGWTALMYASVNGHTECVKLLRDVEAGLQCLDGMTALIEAAQHGKTEVVQLLLEKEGGLSTNECFEHGSGFTALMAACRSNHYDAAKLLYDCEKGMTQADGWTALMWAASEGQYRCVRLMMPAEAGMVINESSEEFRGWTAMTWAVSNGNIDCAELLAKDELDKSRNDILRIIQTSDDLSPDQIRQCKDLLM